MIQIFENKNHGHMKARRLAQAFENNLNLKCYLKMFKEVLKNKKLESVPKEFSYQENVI